MSQYKDYFQRQYKVKLSGSDLFTYRKWFYAQWKFFLPKVQISKSTEVLEIGSGIGTLYSFLEPIVSKGNYLGLELDKSAAEFTREFFKSENFLTTPIEEFRSKNDFNIVFAFEVLEHLEDPFKSICKIKDVLNKKGTFVGTSPFPYPKNIYADKTHKYVLHPENWKKLFLDSGFNSVETYPLTYFPFIWRMNKYFNIRIPFYLPFPFFISTTLIIARK